MIVKILGFLFVALGVWGIAHTTSNRKNMPIHVFGINRDSYEVIDRPGLNSLLVLRGYTMAAFLIVVGALAIKTEAVVYFLLGGFTNLLSLTFTAISKKKYIRMISNT